MKKKIKSTVIKNLQNIWNLVWIGKKEGVFVAWVVKIYQILVKICQNYSRSNIFIYKILVNLSDQLVNQKSLVNNFWQCMTHKSKPILHTLATVHLDL